MERNETTARRLRAALRALLVAALAATLLLATSADWRLGPVADADAPTTSTLEALEEEQEAHEGAGAKADLRQQAKHGPIVGVDDGAGWGTATARALTAASVTWTRLQIGVDSVSGSLADGFEVLAIAGNVEDGTPLSKVEPAKWGNQVVSQLKSNPGISLAEAGNEMYKKGGIAEPVQYGKMYLAAVEDMKRAGIATPLLFNMEGDYERPGGVWSLDAQGGGWLRDAVRGVPGLATAILANGVSIHPYGEVGENRHDTYGIAAAAADEALSKTVLGATPRFYVTEVGYDLARCGAPIGACSERQQASKLRAAYRALIADPNVEGIWWYQTRDDSTGQFGVVDANGSTRPSLRSLSRFARKAGQ